MKTSSRLFAYTRMDAIPVLCAVAHFAYVLFLFYLFPTAPWWLLIILGLIYSVAIDWNISSIAHNLIHNPYFRWKPLNYAFSLLESVTMGFSQMFYDQIHTRHHMGNSDRKNENGETTDWLSIYRHSHDDEPESVWKYTFLGYFRDDPRKIFREIKRKKSFDAYFGVFEIASWVCIMAVAAWFNWKFLLYYLPFYYFGHCLAFLNGYYRHYGGNPDEPIAWGVSSYHRLYNWTWFNAGYHAEHHFRPKVHWTEMKLLRDRIVEEQRCAGTRVIAPPHALGFLHHEPARQDSTTATPESGSETSRSAPAGL
ncbi:MAG: fatty acid desaturase [Chthoniobacterales bacterium]|nr:fatty acid desaturase [Chthoniobacterales bacterium]